MYIGQYGVNPWLKNTWFQGASPGQQKASGAAALSQMGTQVQRTGINRDRVEFSGPAPALTNRLQILETPAATKAESNLDLSAELLPPSEQEAYTEDDALMNQYMKQYRLDFIKDGDTFVLDPSKPVKLMLEGQVSQESLDEFRAKLEAEGLGDEIDWRGVQEDFIQMDLRLDNAERFAQKVDYLASRYAVLKDRIQTQYTGEKLEQEMQTLDTLYTKAKEEMASSYADNIGGFYEELGQSGAAEDMRESILAAIDEKADKYVAYLAENDIAGDIIDPSQQWLKQDDGYMAARLRERAASSVDPPAARADTSPAPYNAADLAFAAVYAKECAEQLNNPQWDTYEVKESDADLGQFLALQYQSLTGQMTAAGVSDRLSDLLKDSFKPFIGKLLDALDEKISHNRERVAEKPWQAGLIRTDNINRDDVYRAFEQMTKHDRMELPQEQSQAILDVPDQITVEIPRTWTIMGETLESYHNHLQRSLDRADRMNLSFGERLTFLREEGQKWVEDKRQNDPDMFVAWLKIHQDYIQRGEGQLVGLPSNFTMEDYNFYVKGPFSALV